MSKFKRGPYRGELAREPHLNEIALLANALRVIRPELSFVEAIDRALHEYHVDLLHALLQHHSIDGDDPNCWLRLSYALALTHIPAFSVNTGAKKRAIGRPRQNSSSPAAPTSSARRVRRPDPARDGRLEQLLRSVIAIKQKFGLRGRGVITRALEKIIEAEAKESGKSVTRLRENLLPKWQKRISEAKKKFPELARKLDE